MTLDYLLSFKHEIDGNYILFARRRECAAPCNINLPVIDDRYCPYCGAELVEDSAHLISGPGGWLYSMYECGTESAPGSYIYSISFPTSQCLTRSYVYNKEKVM